MNYIRLIASKFGIDKSIAYSSSSRIIQGIAGVGSILFISMHLTGVEQGFYFTFGSILALQIFFELGLTNIISQFVAHEASHLQIIESRLEGDVYYKSRLSSLLHFCLKWYGILSLLVLGVLLILGYVYFLYFGDTQAKNVEWKYPWLILCIAVSIQSFISPFHSILIGLGYVKETSIINFYQQLILPIAMWLGLSCGLKLYVSGIGFFISNFIWIIIAYRYSFHRLLYNIWKEPINNIVSYRKEIFPFQWRIAISWISTYFIFQLFNPVLFATDGAVVAGQMGLTLSALNAINSLSLSWVNTKVPIYSKYIALKDYKSLDSLFNKTLMQMSTVCFILLFCFFLLVETLRYTHFRWGESILGYRFLETIPLILMMIPILISQFTNSWTTYIRCHKKEPFMIYSMVTGISCLISTFFLGHMFGLYGITIGYCSIMTIYSPWAYLIYKNNKNKWHNEQNLSN